MPQGTVKHFDPDTGTGTVLLDDETEVALDAETFAVSGLEELRIGQRVRLGLTDDHGEGRPRVARISLISI
jgi:cold shock CspA family protein